MIKQICLSWSDGREEGAIQVEVVYSARRTLGLEVKADGSVLARVPRRMPDQAVKEFEIGRASCRERVSSPV